VQDLTAKLVSKVPRLKRLLERKNQLEIENKQLDESNKELQSKLEEARRWSLVPAGHFYSPVANLDDVKKRQSKIWPTKKQRINDVDLNEKEQLKLLKPFKKYWLEQLFNNKKTPVIQSIYSLY
jgi:hypothetical protein